MGRRVTVGHRVLLHVKQGLIVFGPGEIRGHFGELVFEIRARVQIDEADSVDATATRILCIGQEILAGADCPSTNPEEVVSLGQLVHIQQDLFGGIQRVFLAAVDGILQSVLETGVIQIIPFAEGETIWTESSYKYSREQIADLASRAGFEVEKIWTDAEGLFSVQYLSR